MNGVAKLAEELGKTELEAYQDLEVVGISPSLLGWTDTEFAQVVQIIQEYHSNPSSMVGADPEFEVLNSRGSWVHASRHITGRCNAQIGVDGADSTGELRPEPGSPEKVADNVRKLLLELKEQLPRNFKIRAGAGREVPLGGHIHVSGRRLTNSLRDALQTFIADPLNEKGNQRVRGGYARPRVFRDQPHGWEYRSPCSWLAHPDLTKGALTIAWCLCQMRDRDIERLGASRNALLDAMGPRREVGERFYSLLSKTQSLESIEVFRAWKMESEVPVADEIDRTVAAAVSTRDNNMSSIADMNLGGPVEIRIVGAGYHRGPRNRRYIMVPVGWNIGVERPANLQILHWERDSIGLSYGLRRNLLNSSRGTRGRSLWHTTRRVLQTLMDRNLE